jgi:hypothetical protein
MRSVMHGRLESLTINGVVIYCRDADTSSTQASSVVGGSLDGAAIPPGTRDGQRLVWDAARQRWIG